MDAKLCLIFCLISFSQSQPVQKSVGDAVVQNAINAMGNFGSDTTASADMRKNIINIMKTAFEQLGSGNSVFGVKVPDTLAIDDSVFEGNDELKEMAVSFRDMILKGISKWLVNSLEMSEDGTMSMELGFPGINAEGLFSVTENAFKNPLTGSGNIFANLGGTKAFAQINTGLGGFGNIKELSDIKIPGFEGLDDIKIPGVEGLDNIKIPGVKGLDDIKIPGIKGFGGAVPSVANMGITFDGLNTKLTNIPKLPELPSFGVSAQKMVNSNPNLLMKHMTPALAETLGKIMGSVVSEVFKRIPSTATPKSY